MQELFSVLQRFRIMQDLGCNWVVISVWYFLLMEIGANAACLFLLQKRNLEKLIKFSVSSVPID